MVNIIALAIVFILVVLAVTYMYHAKRRGVHCPGCSSCSGCSGCSSSTDLE